VTGLGVEIVAWLMRPHPGVTTDALSKVQAGMTVAEVEALFGCSGRAMPSPFPAAAVAKNLEMHDFDSGAGGRAAVISWKAGARSAKQENGTWRTWDGREGDCPLILAVHFDDRGTATKTVGFQLADSFTDRLRRWLGL
jgi:hypothetical protein